MKTLTTFFRKGEKQTIRASLTLRELTNGTIGVSLFDSKKQEFIYDEVFKENEKDVAYKLYELSQKTMLPYFDNADERIETTKVLK